MSVFEAETKLGELLEAHTHMKYVRKYINGFRDSLYVEEAAMRLERARREVIDAMVRP